MPPKTAAAVTGIKKALAEEFRKWLARVAIWAMAAVLVYIFTPIKGQVLAVWHAPEAIAAVQATQEAIRADLGRLRQEVSTATGENRVIRQPPGQSYVEEPVRVGSNVVMIMTVARTTLGRDCVLQDWIPLFTDGSNVAIPGERAQGGSVRRQIGPELVRNRVEMIPPRILRPGRIEVYLTLEYECGAQTVFERSDVVSYTLLPPEN